MLSSASGVRRQVETKFTDENQIARFAGEPWVMLFQGLDHHRPFGDIDVSRPEQLIQNIGVEDVSERHCLPSRMKIKANVQAFFRHNVFSGRPPGKAQFGMRGEEGRQSRPRDVRNAYFIFKFVLSLFGSQVIIQIKLALEGV